MHNYRTFSLQKLAIISIGLFSVIGYIGTVSVLKTPDMQSSGFLSPKPQLEPLQLDKTLLPLFFEKNMGQVNKKVKYLSRNSRYTLFFTPNEIVLNFARADALRLQLLDSNPDTVVQGRDQLASYSNYFMGNQSKNWHVDVPHYAGVSYQNIYPGIGIYFYNKSNKLEYDVQVTPQGNVKNIKLQLVGMQSLRLSSKGDLIITTHAGNTLHMRKPVVYQWVNKHKHYIKGRFILKNNVIGFAVGLYNHKKTLIIDPVIDFSTYLGGSGFDTDSVAFGLVTSKLKLHPNIYIIGYTNAKNFPTDHPMQDKNKGDGRTAFVAKLSSNGRRLIYSTYLGGSGNNDEAFAIDVDLFGNAYITGETNSKDFPLKHAMQEDFKNPKYFSAFVTKLNARGNKLIYSTYLGGSGEDQEGNAIAVDKRGNAYITGETNSTDFPIKNALQPLNKSGNYTAYITKLCSHGELMWSTYLGGSGGRDEGNGIALANNKDVVIVGETNSKDFPIKDPIQATPGPKGAGQTGFVTRIKEDGQELVFSTYLGGSGGNDHPLSVDISPLGDIALVGYTNSLDYPVVNAFQNKNKGPNFTGFITKINSRGSAIDYSTYFGGSGGKEQINQIKIDKLGNMHVVGFTNSNDFPLKDAIQKVNLSGKTSAFVATLCRRGELKFSTYLGGRGGNNRAWGVAVTPFLNTYVVGETNSFDFPIKHAMQDSMVGRTMAFVTKIKN